MLQGTLEDFPLTDVLRFLALTGKSGRLRVTVDGAEGHIQLVAGCVSYAASPARAPALVRTDAGGPDAAETAARERIAGAVVDLMRCRRGRFVFEPGQPPSGETEASPLLPVEGLLARELERRLLDGLRRSPQRSDGAPSAAPIPEASAPLDGIDEDVVLRLIDGVREL